MREWLEVRNGLISQMAASPAAVFLNRFCRRLTTRSVARFLEKYLAREQKLMVAAEGKQHHCTLAWDCLVQCGLRDSNPKHGQFCIDHHLAAALRGDTERGLFFRGSEPLPFGARIRPVWDLVAHLLS